jgi:hypothetical protein
MTAFLALSPAYAAEEAEASEKKHVQPIMSPPGVPIGPIMPVRRSPEEALKSPHPSNEPGFFARQWARLRQFSIEEAPSTEQ